MARPTFQRGVGYGDYFDREILDATRAGVKSETLAAHLGISTSFICDRRRAFGYRAPGKPYLQRREDYEAGRPVRSATNPSQSIASLMVGRRDEGPSRLARALRNRPPAVGGEGLDPSHGIACLHVAGLTLPEIEDVAGVPMSAAIAAIRQHCAPLGSVSRGVLPAMQWGGEM